MLIYVRLLTGRTLSLNIDSSDAIEQIKQKIEELEGISVVQQRLIYGGKQLK